MKKGRERDKQTLVKIAKALYNVSLKRNIPMDELENLDFNVPGEWLDLLEKASSALSIDHYDLDELSFYTLLVLENIDLIKENKLNEETIFIPELKDFSFDVTQTTTEVWTRTYRHTFQAYDYNHAREALIFDINQGTTDAWDGDLIQEDSDSSDIESTNIE
jgi:hypothetical protein